MTKEVEFQGLRRRAMELFAQEELDLSSYAPGDLERLIEELRIHQIELEVQNTELLQIQRSLEESKSRYMGLFHQAPAGYVVLSREGVIVSANQTFGSMVDELLDMLRGKSLADFVHPEDRSVFLHRLRPIYANPEGKVLSLRLLRGHSGESMHVEVRFRIQDGLTPGGPMLLTVIDVSERVRAQQEMLREQALWHYSFDNVPDLMVIVDREQRVKRVNRTFCKRLGLTLGEVEGQSLPGLLRVDPVILASERVLPTSGGLEIFVELLDATFLVTTTQLKAPYQDLSVVLLRDITPLKKSQEERIFLEKELAKAQKAESLNTMAGAIAHIYNNLLCVSTVAIEMLRDELSPVDPLMNHVRSIESANEDAVKLSLEMLKYLGHPDEPLHRFDAQPVLLSLPDPHRFHPRVTYRADIPHIPLPVHGDQGRFRQMLENLLENSIEAMAQEGGVIHLKVQVEEGEDHRLLISVKDNGAGMTSEVLERCRDPFFTTRFQGGGGLALVTGIVKLHRGELSIESAAGEGTLVTLSIPLLDPSGQ